jgi:integrase
MTRIGVRTQQVHPRIHDLRHRFAVQTLIDWQRSGVNIDEHIATLSTYLGHYAARAVMPNSKRVIDVSRAQGVGGG